MIDLHVTRTIINLYYLMNLGYNKIESFKKKIKHWLQLLWLILPWIYPIRQDLLFTSSTRHQLIHFLVKGILTHNPMKFVSQYPFTLRYSIIQCNSCFTRYILTGLCHCRLGAHHFNLLILLVNKYPGDWH